MKKLVTVYEPTYCCLPRLAEIIESYYYHNKIMFPNLTEFEVKYIIQCMKLKGIDGGPHKRWSMWFNSMQSEEPYQGLTCRESS